MQNKYRFALVGCGRISKKHLEAIEASENAELAAVCDIDPKRAESVGMKYGVPHYVSYDEMLKSESVDIVNILTPSGLHAAQTIDIVKKYRKP